MSRLPFFISSISVLLFLLVIISVRRSRIRAEYSVGWLLAAVALFCLSRSGWLLNGLARVFRVDQPPEVLLLGVFGVFLLLFFWASILISRLRDDTIELVQRIAILEFQMNHLQKSVRAQDGQSSQSV